MLGQDVPLHTNYRWRKEGLCRRKDKCQPKEQDKHSRGWGPLDTGQATVSDPGKQVVEGFWRGVWRHRENRVRNQKTWVPGPVVPQLRA